MKMKKLHLSLYLKGLIPEFKNCSYFRRFDPEIIEDRKVTTKQLLEFVAEYPPLFTSVDFVNFLETGYPEPDGKIVGNIDTIRSSLHLPIEETTPLEYQSSEEDTYSTTESQSASIYDVGSISSFIKSTQNAADNTATSLKVDVENKMEVSKNAKTAIAARLSIDSISSLGSGSSCSLPYEEVMKMPVNLNKSQTLPDLICFDIKSKPSTSGLTHRNFDDYHDMGGDIFKSDSSTSSSLRMVDSYSEPISLNTSISSVPTNYMSSEIRSTNTTSEYTCSVSGGDKRLAPNSSRHTKECSQTEDTYVFEAGYLLNLGARCEDTGEYKKAFDCYKSGLEKMLIGVQNDSDDNRRRIVKEKITKYLSYAETIYINHLSGLEDMILDEQSKVMLLASETPTNYRSAIPLNMLRRPYEDLSKYRVLGIISGRIMLVLFSEDQQCYAMKVVEKIPQNLTEFDNYFSHQNKDVKMPILPTTIPYMVQLKCFIETPNLLFIVLDYASGGKLLDYIANYVKSTPATPAREVNLDNIFLEPQHGRRYSRSESRIEDIVLKSDTKSSDGIDYAVDAMLDGATKTELARQDNRAKNAKRNNNNDIDLSVNDLVINSQRLLLNVSDVLNGKRDDSNNTTYSDTGNTAVSCQMSAKDNVAHKEIHVKCNMDVLAPSSVCKWGAEILTAIEYLHGSGVVCRDLNPNNLLLAERGHLTLTYMVGYEDADVTMALLSKDCAGHCTASHSIYVAPEVYNASYFITDEENETNKDLDRVCDFWSFGAIMYELITGVPLSTFHPEGFNSHTILQLPDELPLEVESLLTQLLIYDPKERLGSGPTGIEEIKQHPYFKNIHWKSIYDEWISPD